MQRIKPHENNVGVRRLCRQLAADRAADFHPFAGVQRFRIANAHDHKAAGGKAMRRKDFDDALSLSLEIRDFIALEMAPPVEASIFFRCPKASPPLQPRNK